MWKNEKFWPLSCDTKLRLLREHFVIPEILMYIICSSYANIFKISTKLKCRCYEKCDWSFLLVAFLFNVLRWPDIARSITLKLLLIKLSPLFRSLLNNKCGYKKKKSALEFKLHKLIQCLKMIFYNMFHNSEINIDQIISPFGLQTSR